MIFTEEEIQQRLETALALNRPPESPYPMAWSDDPPQPAAVLMPFLCTEEGWQLLFIRRTLHPKDRHGGQVAFPGGRCDPEDPNAVRAALREAHEEVGLLPDDVRILGQLRDMMTITNYQVTPIVGAFPWPYQLTPQPEEVSRIFAIPLSWLADPANRLIEQRQIQQRGVPIPVIHFQPYDGEILWGASARMTMLLLEAMELSDPEARYK
jgi:8-oxo-dGTP pyrophosphatase MutT (NUDIX family)